MAANHQNTYVLNSNINQICNVIRNHDFSSRLDLIFRSENPTQSGVWFRFHHGVSFSSWGEKITITLSYLNPVTTQLQIHSECGLPTQFIDWGKNKKIVNSIHDYILSCAVPQQMNMNAVQNVTHMQTQSQISKGSFCSNCGNAILPGSAFCAYCGQKIN